MLTIATIAGGVALILFGARYLRKGLDRLFGQRLAAWIGRLTDSRPKAFISGLCMSVIAPSSTTMSVLTVQAVQSGHISSRQALVVMLGADIGLTVMVLLISLRMDQYAPILVLIGVGLFHFTSAARSRGIGQVVLSLGFVFLGIGTIKSQAAIIAHNQDVMELIRIAGERAFLVSMVATVMAIVLQSSTATIGLVIGLGALGVLSLPTAMAVVIGANVGIVVTTLFVGWGRIESRRLAIGNLIAKLAVAALTLTALDSFAAVIQWIPGRFDHWVAYSHMGFNVIVASLGLVMIGPINRLVEALVVEPPGEEQPAFGPRFINVGTPDSLALALGQAMREIGHVAEIVRSMLGDLWRALQTGDEALVRHIGERDDKVDLLDSAITQFLIRAVKQQGEQDEASEQIRQLRYLSELETIGDIIDKNLCELVIKKIKLGTEFSEEGWRELDDFYHKITENMLIADLAFTRRDRLLAQQLLRHKERINQHERELRDRHFARLNAGLAESHETSAIHLDLLTHLKRINSCVSHVAYSILQDRDGQPDH